MYQVLSRVRNPDVSTTKSSLPRSLWMLTVETACVALNSRNKEVQIVTCHTYNWGNSVDDRIQTSDVGVA